MAEVLDAAATVVNAVLMTKAMDVDVPMAVCRYALFVCLFERRALDRGWCF